MSLTDTIITESQSSVTEAAVGVIQREDGLVLLAERPAGKPWSGYWEFPGGKIEANETPCQALKRELKEELGIIATLIYPWLTRTFDYKEKYDSNGNLESKAKTVKLHFFVVTEWQGEPFGLEKQKISWQNPQKVAVTPILPANAPIFNGLSLPSIYAITNLSELGEKLFFTRFRIALEGGLKLIQVREKQLSESDLRLFSDRVIEMATPYNAKVLINSDLNLALKSKASGVHFTSQDLMKLLAKPVGILSGASCHNRQELMQAEMLGLDYVMLSPVQATLSHADACPLGWDNFSDLISGCSLPVYALGGMQKANLHNARLHGAHGVAMQRDVWR